MGEPKDPDVSRYDIVTNPLYRREGFARSGRKDKQTTLALVFVEVEALLHRLERIQLMLERSFRDPPLLFVTEIVQDKAMKTHGIASCAGSAEESFICCIYDCYNVKAHGGLYLATRQKLSVVKIDIETCRAGLDFDIEE